MNDRKTPEVSVAGPQDAERILSWSQDNGLDHNTLLRPSTTILKAENGKPLSYSVLQGAFVLESIASNPAATRGELALALREHIKAIREVAAKYGITDLYAFTSLPDDRDLEKLAAKRGFTKMPYTAWHLKIER